MNDESLNVANIENLTALWQAMGAKPCPLRGMEKFCVSSSWPHRCWLMSSLFPDEIERLSVSINQLKKGTILPVLALSGITSTSLEEVLVLNGFEVLHEQMAMYLDLKSVLSIERPTLKLQSIKSAQDIKIWTEVASVSFGYDIDISVIHNVSANNNVQLLMGYLDSQAIATAMLFNTNNIAGLHQVGVLPRYRGQGIARQLMQHIIALCYASSNRYITLQASASAEALYASLGFYRQFKMSNYQQINKI